MSDIVNIADGVLGIINANAVPLVTPFTAIRTYSPVYDHVAMKDVRIFVMPTGPQAIARATRSECERTYTVMIGIAKSDIEDDASFETMVTFLEKVLDLFTTNYRLENPDSVLIEIKNESVFNPQDLDQRNVFATVVELQYTLLR